MMKENSTSIQLPKFFKDLFHFLFKVDVNICASKINSYTHKITSIHFTDSQLSLGLKIQLFNNAAKVGLFYCVLHISRKL